MFVVFDFYETAPIAVSRLKTSISTQHVGIGRIQGWVMGDIHKLILNVGVKPARQLVRTKRKRLVDLVGRLFAEESEEVGFSYSGLCLAALPHRRQPDDKPWKLETPRVTLLIEPCFEVKHGLTPTPIGVPYGYRSRLIIRYLKTQAVCQRRREIVLRGSIASWMSLMGVPNGEKSYREVREQISLLSRCSIFFPWNDDNGGDSISRTSMVESELLFVGNDNSSEHGILWEETVTLSEQLFEKLVKHPVPIWEPAIRALSNKSMVLDAYVWLAFRLYSLRKPTPISWTTMHQQLGYGFAAAKDFQAEFKKSQVLVLSAYEQARDDIGTHGIVLHPSPPPIPEIVSTRVYI